VTSLTILIPVPPSANKLTFNRSGGRVKTPAYTKWGEEAGWHVRDAMSRAGHPAFVAPLGLSIRLGIGHNRDVSNCIKPIEDMLCEHIPGLPDDKWNDTVSASRAELRAGMAEVTIASIAPT
jgi:hypothetical protein